MTTLGWLGRKTSTQTNKKKTTKQKKQDIPFLETWLIFCRHQKCLDEALWCLHTSFVLLEMKEDWVHILYCRPPPSCNLHSWLFIHYWFPLWRGMMSAGTPNYPAFCICIHDFMDYVFITPDKVLFSPRNMHVGIFLIFPPKPKLWVLFRSTWGASDDYPQLRFS